MGICDVQTFVDSLEDAIVVIDDSLRVVLANAAALRICGLPAEQVLRHPCYVSLHGRSTPCDNRPHGICAVQTVWVTGQPVCVRHHHLDVGGCVHVMEICASALPGAESGSPRVIESMRDVTRQAELETETAQRHRELAALNQITSAIARSLDVETLAPELLELAAGAVAADGGAIYHAHAGEPVLVSAKGIDVPSVLAGALYAVVVESEKPLILPDARADPRWAQLVPAQPFPSSLLCVPLADQEHCRGMLLLAKALPQPWPAADVRLVLMAAQQMAIGLERAHLFRAEAERARSLEEANARLSALEQARRQALQRAMTAEEDERRRIAAELHDDTAQALAALIVGMDTALAMLEHSPSAAREQLAHLKRSTSAIVEDIDSIIAALRPALLDDLGLLPALRAYAAERLDPLGVAWQLREGDITCRLPPATEMVLFRVVQEAISNIARHAQARQAVITITCAAEGTTVQVRDDGLGFDVGERLDPGRRQLSFGLLGMQERLASLGGRLQIESGLGQGTQLEIFVPGQVAGGQT